MMKASVSRRLPAGRSGRSQTRDFQSDVCPDQRSPCPMLATGFVIISLLLFVEVALSLSQMRKLQGRLAQVVEEYNVRGELAQEMHKTSRERAILLHAMISTDDSFERDDLYVELRALGSRFLTAREQIASMALGDDERELLNRQGERSRAAGSLQYRVIDLLTEDRIEEAKRVLLQEAIPAQDRALSLVQEFANLQQSHNQQALAATSEEFRQADRLLLIIGFVTLLLSALVAAFVLQRTKGMMSALSRSNAELRDAGERLEERVAERTAELRRLNEKLLSEINERRSAERKLAFMATHDDLTKLPNRALFNEHLQHAMARAQRAKTRLALFFVDLDGFKRINDTLGHEAGDQVLREVASRLKSGVRAQDLVARLGGDEFTLLLEDIDHPANAATLAAKVIELVSRPIALADQMHEVGASIGIAFYPDDAEDLDALIRSADDAMYVVKRAGKGDYGFHQTPKPAPAISNIPFQW